MLGCYLDSVKRIGVTISFLMPVAISHLAFAGNDNTQLAQSQRSNAIHHFEEAQANSAKYSAQQQSNDQKNSNNTGSLNQLSYFGHLSSADYNHLSHEQQEGMAQEFMLTPVEFKKYLEIKSRTAIGQYYQDRNMNPNFILADYYLQSGNDAKANQYIRHYAQMEHDEVARQLMIQRRFQRFAQQLFPTETPIHLQGAIPQNFTSYNFHPHSKGGLVNIDLGILGANKVTDDAKYIIPVTVTSGVQHKQDLQNLFSRLSTLNNTRVDLYILDQASNASIYQWVDENALTPYLNSGKATINHAGKFIPALDKRLGKKVKAGQLIKDNQGMYRVMDWSVINGQ